MLSIDPQQETGQFPILEDNTSSEPLCSAFVTGLIRSIEIYEWILWTSQLSKPWRSCFPVRISVRNDRQGYNEITNARHHLYLWLVRLRPLLLVLSLFL